MLPAPSVLPYILRALQWNAGGLRARSTALLHFISSHPVDLICIQKFILNSSSPFRIPRFSDMRSDRPHSRSGMLSPNDTHVSGGVAGLFLLRTFHLFSSFDPYSDYVGVNISPNDSSSLSLLNVCDLPIHFSSTNSRTDSFFPLFFPPPKNSLFWRTSTAISPRLGFKKYFCPP